MQKKIIALAVAGIASGAAFAQSNVTIYGIADVGFAYATSNANTANNPGQGKAGYKFSVASGQTAGSRLGFKGEEALGNGLKAIWTLEQGIAFDNGQSTTHGTNGGDTAGANNTASTGGGVYQRQAFAGLASNYGNVTFGRQYTPFFAVKANSDAFGLGHGGTLNNMFALNYVPGNADRLNNVMAYTSPTFAGFTGVLAYSSGQENNTTSGQNTPATNDAAGRAWGGYLQYSGYGAYVGLGYHNVVTGANLTSTNVTADHGTTPVLNAAAATAYAQAWVLGANYNIMNVATVYGTYATGKAQLTSDPGTNVLKGHVWALGAKAPFGAHTVMAQYTSGHDSINTNSDAALWGVGYEYSLSKRTALYASYAHLVNEARQSLTLNGATTQTGLTNTEGGLGRQGIMAGMRHSF